MLAQDHPGFEPWTRVAAQCKLEAAGWDPQMFTPVILNTRDGQMIELFGWLYENKFAYLITQDSEKNSVWWFASKDHAMMFKLRWQGVLKPA